MDTDADKDIENDVLQEERLKARLAMFDKNVELARVIAKSLYKRRSGSDIEFQDYLHYAFAGLLESIDRYDMNFGASFKTFASYRIRGSIINGLEKFSEHREQVAFLRILSQERLQSLSKEMLSTSRDNLFEEMVELTFGLAVGYILEGKYARQEETILSSDVLYTKYIAERNNMSLLQYVEGLPEHERFVVKFHYFYHTPFAEIALSLGVSKGRISQIHHRGIQLLKQFYAKNDVLDNYL